MPDSDLDSRTNADAQSHLKDLDLLRDAGAEAATIAMRYFRRQPETWMKSGQSPVSEADIAVDRFLRNELMAARPDYGWLSEETEDDLARLERPATFVVDPIDGTRGFLDGSDAWCVSLAVVRGGRTVAGVLNCPASGEVFEATTGTPAICNGEQIAVSEPHSGYYIAGPKPMIDAAALRLDGSVRRHAYVPSLAYRVAMVAAGRFDGTYVKPNAHDWDIAAADIILERAGGSILRPDGTRPAYAGRRTAHGALVAASGHVLPKLLSAMA